MPMTITAGDIPYSIPWGSPVCLSPRITMLFTRTLSTTMLFS
ncbi:hypothetical protein Vi05172_g2881 [Venturia inaequalis]|nr:hypothetical protein Vi05172_g2881 [Venturia inaequalis]